jgi:hypothetical protein
MIDKFLSTSPNDIDRYHGEYIRFKLLVKNNRWKELNVFIHNRIWRARQSWRFVYAHKGRAPDCSAINNFFEECDTLKEMNS